MEIKKILEHPLFFVFSGVIVGFLLGDITLNYLRGEEMLIIKMIKFILTIKLVWIKQ